MAPEADLPPPPPPPSAGRCGGRATAPPSTSPRPPSCSPPAATTSTSCSRRRPASATPGCVDAGRPGVVTYSRKVFIPLTRLCRDRCHYCTFATVPHRLPAAFLERDEVLAIASAGAAQGCKEALFTLGDRPEERWPAAREWLESRGYHSTLEYVRACAVAVLEETGLLPHLNPGVMSWEELHAAQAGRAVDGHDAGDHRHAAVERAGRPALRQPRQGARGPPAHATDAGRVGVPFTTGILIGIGENREERAESLFAIRAAARAHGHIQEVIVQNFRAKPDTAMAKPGRRPRRPRRHHRRRPPVLGPEDARAGAAEPRRRGVRADAPRGHRRLGRGLAGHRRPRQPRAALAAPSTSSPPVPPKPVSRSGSGSRRTRSTCSQARRGSTPGCTRTSRRWPTRFWSG